MTVAKYQSVKQRRGTWSICRWCHGSWGLKGVWGHTEQGDKACEFEHCSKGQPLRAPKESHWADWGIFLLKQALDLFTTTISSPPWLSLGRYPLPVKHGYSVKIGELHVMQEYCKENSSPVGCESARGVSSKALHNSPTIQRMYELSS